MRSSNRGGCGSPLWNFGTLMFLGLTVLLFFWVVMLAMDKNATLGGIALNPWAPDDTVVEAVPTFAVVPLITLPTTAPSDTPQPVIEFQSTATSTAEAAETTETAGDPTSTSTLAPIATQTQWVAGPTNTPAPTFKVLWFDYMSGTPAYQPADTCDGMWIGGAVFNAESAPYTLIWISLSGLFGDVDAYVGTAEHLGESGFEFQITSDGPKTGQISLQLYDSDTFEEVSELKIIDTKASCDENYILVNFVQVEKP